MSLGPDNLMGGGRRRSASESDGDVMSITLNPAELRQLNRFSDRNNNEISASTPHINVLGFIDDSYCNYRLGFTHGLGGILVLLRFLDLIILSLKIMLMSGGQLISVPYNPWSLLNINMMGFVGKLINVFLGFSFLGGILQLLGI